MFASARSLRRAAMRRTFCVGMRRALRCRMNLTSDHLGFEITELLIDAYDLLRVTQRRPELVRRTAESFVARMDEVLRELVFDGPRRGLRAEMERVADMAAVFDDGGALCENDLDEQGRALAARCRARLLRLALLA